MVLNLRLFGALFLYLAVTSTAEHHSIFEKKTSGCRFAQGYSCESFKTADAKRQIQIYEYLEQVVEWEGNFAQPGNPALHICF
jgi:hypothetical protein